MSDYFRPLPQFGPPRPADAPRLAGGWCWFDRVEHLRRDAPAVIRPVSSLPPDLLDRLTLPRAAVAGIGLDRPRLMGILNVTPDSFSDGGDHMDTASAVRTGAYMAAQAEFLDIGGESTRPGAVEVPEGEEIARTQPIVSALSQEGIGPISIDTRKAGVAAAALAAGASLVNDVSAFGFDPALAKVVADAQVPVCLMHAQGTPETMQADPSYNNVLLDVYDALADRVTAAVEAGIPRSLIIVDPGIGFGKTLDHNLALLSRVSLFHGLGCAILLGASRKRFVGTIGHASDPKARAPGSMAVALAAVGQGVQILRVHDTAETRQALRLFTAAQTGQAPEDLK